MAQRGKPSAAHIYDKNDACIYCHMYRCNVNALSHVCTVERERVTDLVDQFKKHQEDEHQVVQNG